MCTYKGYSQMWILAALIVALVAGCGSGGGGGVSGGGGGAGIPDSNPGTVSTEAGAVFLGAAGEYAVFGDAGIHNTNSSVITGNIGAGPGVTSTAITGFALSLPAASTFSTSAQVNGRVYAYDYAPPTPTNMNTASLYMGSAYTDATSKAGGSCPGSGGNITGAPLAAGVYTCAVNVTIPVDLTLNGSATDVWVFQITGTLTMAAAKNIILTGGALPQNIFWQVSGAVTVGANSHFEGIILGKTAITFGNLSSINGRLLSQTAVTLDATTVKRP